MTLASRLSTQANMGLLDTPDQQWSLIKSNLALVQCQAIVVGFLSSIAAVVMGWIPDGLFDIHHCLLISASAVLTASIASFVLGIPHCFKSNLLKPVNFFSSPGVIMISVIVLSHRYHINPDNVATPIAASLGDLTTLGLLAAIARLLYPTSNDYWWVSVCVVLVYITVLPLFVWIARSNVLTKEVLSTGWSPVLAAMAISR